MVKASELRNMNRQELLIKLNELKTELWQLRMNKVSSSNASKLPKIRIVRKDIARVLTVINQKRKEALRKKAAGMKYKPLDLRPKLTRAKRRELTPKQKNKKTLRQIKREQNFPKRNFAVKKV